MVGSFGEVLVMDWGVACVVGEASPSFVAGTYGFMAPEQERGDAVDVRADIFALGGILRELVSDAPKPLRAVIAKCLASNADERFADAAQLAAEIARYLDGEPLITYRESIVERVTRWLSQNRALVAVVIAYVVMRLIVLFFIHR
jgi:serine/threonine-protein kinase